MILARSLLKFQFVIQEKKKAQKRVELLEFVEFAIKSDIKIGPLIFRDRMLCNCFVYYM